VDLAARESGLTGPSHIDRQRAAAEALEPLSLVLVVMPPGHRENRYGVAPRPYRGGVCPHVFADLKAVEQFVAAQPGPPHRAPRINDRVHYVAHGTPVREDGTQAYSSVCRAATITETGHVEVNEQKPFGDGIYRATAGLCVMNPTGMFFPQGVLYDAGEPDGTDLCGGRAFAGGTWHFDDYDQDGEE
jgi:hypothetical protein